MDESGGRADKDQASRYIQIRLSDEQVGEVMQRVTGGYTPSAFMLAHTRGLGQLKDNPLFKETRFSQSLLRGLAVIAALHPIGTKRGIIEVANELGISPSTTHRYMATLVGAGLVVRELDTRRYRLAAQGDDELHADVEPDDGEQ